MNNLTRLFALSLMFFAGTSTAAYISQFNKTTNDGVFTLSADQVSFLGYDPSAVDRIGFFRVREGNGTVFNNGDTFDVTTMQNSVIGGANNIVAFLNGTNADLTYTGNAFEALGTTTVGAADSYFRGVAFLFHSSSGDIVFRGTSTFNGGQTRGAYEGISAVPLPAAAWLFGSAMLGMVGLGYRRRDRKA